MARRPRAARHRRLSDWHDRQGRLPHDPRRQTHRQSMVRGRTAQSPARPSIWKRTSPIRCSLNTPIRRSRRPRPRRPPRPTAPLRRAALAARDRPMCSSGGPGPPRTAPPAAPAACLCLPTRSPPPRRPMPWSWCWASTPRSKREQRIVNYAGFSGGDRTSLDLPAVQERLLEAVMAAAARANPWRWCSRPARRSAVNWANDHVPAIVQAWYPGQHGDAVADVLFGDYNPAGRLPVTFYKSVDDLPAFTNYAMEAGNGRTSGRTYRYFKGAPLYPFGYGLSYTKFEYSKIDVTANPSTTQDVVVHVAREEYGRPRQ